MNTYVRAGALALLGVALTATVVYGVDTPKPPPGGAGTNPCVQIPVPGPQGTTTTRPCPPAPPGSKGGSVLNQVASTAKKAEDIAFDEVHTTRQTIDDWAEDQVDMPLQAARGLFKTVMLTQPGLLVPSQRWVLAGWGLVLPFGLLLCLLAWLNHARHGLQGTDLLHRRNPFVRFTIPVACLVGMLITPWMWELGRVTQEYAWAADSFDRKNADQVLGTVLPPAPIMTAGGAVVSAPAGSIAPIRAKLGTTFGIGSGLALLVLGILGFLGYLVGRFLIIASGLYLGIAAFSDRLEPAVGWADLLLRTNLLVTLFNAAWWVMRHLPGWMAWTLVDAVVFVVLVLPAVLAVIWFLWLPRVASILMDPLMLGGSRVMAGLGRTAGGLGRGLSITGEVLGVTELAGRGDRMTRWGAQTASRGERAGRAAGAGESARAMQQLLPRRARTMGVHQEDVEAVCWRDGNQYVVYVRGVPTWHSEQPQGARLVGDWRGE